MKLLILTLLLSFPCYAQKLSWTKPEGADKDFTVAGYKLLYEIEDEACGTYSDIKRPRYSLDLGNVYEYDLRKDINFQAGLKYFVAVVTYSHAPIKNGDIIKGYSNVESTISNSACVTIRGVPVAVQVNEDGTESIIYSDETETTNEGEENEDNDISLGSIIGATGAGASRNGASELESRRQRHNGRSDDKPDAKFQSILGLKRSTYHDIGKSRIANANINGRANGSKSVHVNDEQSVMVSRKSLLLPSHGGNVRDRAADRSGIRSVKSSSVQNYSAQAKGTDKSNRSININWGLIIGAMGLLGIIKLV